MEKRGNAPRAAARITSHVDDYAASTKKLLTAWILSVICISVFDKML
jgi:hypothetical protein